MVLDARWCDTMSCCVTSEGLGGGGIWSCAMVETGLYCVPGEGVGRGGGDVCVKPGKEAPVMVA